MDIGSLDFKPCKYRVNQCIFHIDGRDDYTLDPICLTEIFITKNFETMAFPYFEITITLPPSTYRDMRAVNTEVRCFLELQYADVPDRMNSAPNEDELQFKTFMQDTFYVFLPDNTPDMQDSFTEEYETAVDLKHDQMSVSDSMTTRLLLYNEEYLFRGRSIVNSVLQNATLMDAVVYIANKAKLQRLLISAPNNVKKYNQLIIPPISAIENICRLANDYGLHRAGTTVFFDFDRGYILDNINKCTAWETNEIRQVYIVSKQGTDGASPMKSGACTDASRKYYALNIEGGKASFSTGSMIVDQSTGTDVITVNSSTGEIHNVSSNAKTSETGGTAQVFVNEHGEDTSEALAYAAKTASRIAKAVFTNVPLDIFKPNKEFIFSFDSAKFANYMGSYHLVGYTAMLSMDGNMMVCQVSADFKGYD